MKTNDLVFPLDGLSPEIKGIIEQFSKVKKCPTNFVGTSMLADIGALAGKRLIIKDGAYINYGQMYACLVDKPGGGKTPAMEVVMEATEDIDYQNYCDYKAQLKLWRAAQKSGKDSEKPKLSKITVDDVTVEKLMSVLSENENGIILHCDELTDLTSNLNRYNNGDNLPKLLKIWSNGSVRVDRKNDEPLMVRRPFLSILSSPRNGIFQSLAFLPAQRKTNEKRKSQQ